MPEFQSFDPAYNPCGLEPYQVPHILIPGRGRQSHGFALTPQGFDRVTVAADFYFSGNMSAEPGFVVPSGPVIQPARSGRHKA